MRYHEYLTACGIMQKVDNIDKAIEYMETVMISEEAYKAIVDMLKYEREGLIEEFRQLSSSSAGNVTGKTPKEMRQDMRDTEEVFC